MIGHTHFSKVSHPLPAARRKDQSHISTDITSFIIYKHL